MVPFLLEPFTYIAFFFHVFTVYLHNMLQYENIPDDTTVVLIVFPAAPEVHGAALKKVYKSAILRSNSQIMYMYINNLMCYMLYHKI